MNTTTPFNKMVNANGRVSFVPTTNKSVLIANARITGANKVYKYKNLFYARATAGQNGSSINGRRPNVFYRVNQNVNGSFEFSKNAAVKNLTYVMSNNEIMPSPGVSNFTRQKFNTFVKQQLARTNLTGNNKAKGQAIMAAWNAANENIISLSRSNNNKGRAANWPNRALHNYMWKIKQASRNNIEASGNRTKQKIPGVWPVFPTSTGAAPGTGPHNTSANPLTKDLNKFKVWYATVQGMKISNRADPYVTIMTGKNRNRKIELGGGIMRVNNNNNSRKLVGGFWNAVNAEMAARAAGAA